MDVWHWIVALDIALSGLVIFGRGMGGSVRRYTAWDGIAGLAECAFIVWIVVTRL